MNEQRKVFSKQQSISKFKIQYAKLNAIYYLSILYISHHTEYNIIMLVFHKMFTKKIMFKTKNLGP